MRANRSSAIIAALAIVFVAHSAALWLAPLDVVSLLTQVVVVPAIAAGALLGPLGGAVTSVAFLAANTIRLLVAPAGVVQDDIGSLVIGSLSVILAATVIGFITRLRRLYQRELEAKETLIREIRHRVSNHLNMLAAMIGLQARFMVDPDNKRKFEQLRERVTTLALLYHQMQTGTSGDSLNFAEYVRELADRLRSTLSTPESDIRIAVDVPDVELTVDMTTSLSLVLSELVTNAFKHGFADRSSGTVTISLSAEDPDEFVLAVTNDGEALTASSTTDRHSLGMTLIGALVSQVDGSLSRGPATPDGTGARFEVRFPRHEAPR